MKLAIIGDVHHLFTRADTTYFNGSDHDAVLFVGDLYKYSLQRGLEAACELAALKKPALLIPGNHDAAHPAQLAAEITQRPSLVKLTAFGHPQRVRELQRAVGGVAVAGYSVHRLHEHLDIIAARPHAMGGSSLSFAPLLAEAHGVRSIADSARKLMRCVDESTARDVVFLAHNGPTGLGAQRHDIWGCDFRREQGDFGDEDLRLAIDHAHKRGKRVLAVVAGHMHHRVRGGGQRTWSVEREGVLYVNAARVPRIFRIQGTRYHHHVDLTIADGRAEAVEVLREPDAGP